jgi:hypothetical protein
MDDKNNRDNEGSYMYERDYGKEVDVEEAIKENHETGGAILGKIAAKLRGRGGRHRGKNGRQENNKARGGKMAR